MGLAIVAFVEGARWKAGGMGLTGVPSICKCLAARGHNVTLGVAGPAIPGADPAGRKEEDGGGFRIVRCAAFGRWAFSPLMIKKLIPEAHSADFLSLHSVYSFPVFLGYISAKSAAKPYGVWPHGVLAPIQRQASPNKKRLYDRLVARAILDTASVIFYSAKGERDEAMDLGLKPPSVIVPHGIDVSRYATLPEHGRFRANRLNQHKGPLVLYLGRLNAKKGIDLLIKAFATVAREHPAAQLAIVGGADPPRFELEVRSWIAGNSLQDKVVVTGLVGELEKRQALADADILVLPSKTENFGFVMFEAMACGIPVVLSDTINLAHMVQEWGAGWVCERRSSVFADAMTRLMNDAPLRREMGRRGIQLAAQYSWESAGERVERTIDSILSGRSLPQDLTMM